MDSKTVQFSYQLLDKGNPVFRVFIICSSILIIKFLCMSFLTAIHRFRTKTPISPEDLNIIGAQEMKDRNDDVERVRRAHRNDMENILPYLSAGLFYVMTDPNPTLAIILFPVTTIARLLHTFVYAVYVVRQPARAILYTIHICITLYMAFMCIVHGIQN